MRIYTRLDFQMVPDGLELVSADSYEYQGEVALCKDDGKKAAAAEQKRANDLQEKALARMYQTQDQVKAGVGQYLDGNIGYDPKQLAIMRAQFLNQTARNYQGAGKNLRAALLRKGAGGGDMPVGGDTIRGIASLEGSLADEKSSGLANIDLNNLQTALANKFNAASLINGQAAQLTSPISTFGSQSANALNEYVASANKPGFMDSFKKKLGEVAGSGVASFASGFFPGAN